MVKMFYLCKLVTVFGRVTPISHLFRAPYFMPDDKTKPPLARSGFSETIGHARVRSLPPLVASINASPTWCPRTTASVIILNSFEERNRRFSQELFGATKDVPLDRAPVADEFASRPPPFRRPLVFHCSPATAPQRSTFSRLVASAGTGSSHPRGKESEGRSPSLLEGISQLQDARLRKWRPKDLQAHGQLSLDHAARNRDPRDSRQRSCNCIYISKIHLEWIVRTLSQFERRNRRSWRQNGVHLGKRIAEILGDQRTNPLPLQVIGVVVTRREHICAENDAALYFRAKSGTPRLAIHSEQGIVIHAQSVAHAVVSRQVGTGFRGGDDVVRRDGVIRMRHVNFDQ